MQKKMKSVPVSASADVDNLIFDTSLPMDDLMVSHQNFPYNLNTHEEQ